MPNFISPAYSATSKPKIFATDTEIIVGIINDPYWTLAYDYSSVLAVLGDQTGSNCVTWRTDSLKWDWSQTVADTTAPTEDYENKVNLREDASISIGLKFKQSVNIGETPSNTFDPLADAYSYDSATGAPMGGVIAIRWTNYSPGVVQTSNLNTEDMLGVYGITSLNIQITGEAVTASLEAVSYGGLVANGVYRAILYGV